MNGRTNRLLSVLVILVALLMVSQVTVVPRNQLLGTIGLITAVGAILFALAEIAHSF